MTSAYHSTGNGTKSPTLSAQHRRAHEVGSAIAPGLVDFSKQQQDAPSDAPEALENALQAAEAGRAVFPLHYKEPTTGATPNGHKDASRERARIHAMFNAARRPVTGYGIATGRPSGLVVVDVDGPEAVEEAKSLGLASGYIVRTGREQDGYHIYLQAPQGVEIKGGDFGEHLRLQADGQYVCGPGSRHPSGRRYRVVKAEEPRPAPPQILGMVEKAGEKASTPRKGRGAVSIDLSGPPIIESQPGRNLELARIAGRLHDGTRTLDALTADLMAMNEARCQPPLPPDEVERIAKSIYARPPCKPPVSDKVLRSVEYLRQAAENRPVRGKAGGSGWSIFHAAMEALTRFGREHAQGVSLSIDCRTLGQMSAKNASTVSRWVRRSPLVRVLDKGSGKRSMTLLFVVPEGALDKGGETQHSTHRGGYTNATPASVAVRPLFRTLYRSRWSKPERKGRRGLPRGTRKVRQMRTEPSPGIKRLGPSRAALLWKIHQHPNARRSEIADMLGLKPGSLTKPLKTLHTLGMIVRTGRGRYVTVADLERRVEEARSLAVEPEHDRLQILRDNVAREAYRNRNTPPQTSEGTGAGRENVERSRRKREEGMREQPRRDAERERQERRTPEEERERQRRIAELVRLGMSRRWAEAEVDGVDPFEDVI
jgi:DNA-binding MarR family transcriptional regulator